MRRLVLVVLAAWACRSRDVALLQAGRPDHAAPEVASAPELCRALGAMPPPQRLFALPDGVTVTGVVDRVRDYGEDGGIDLWLVCDGAVRLRLAFADDGAALRQREPAAGTSIAAHCQLGGSDPGAFYLRGCVLTPVTPPPASPAGG